MKRYWFFDLDGTLADTDPDIRGSWKAALVDLGVECPNFDSEFVAGPPIEEMAARLLPDVYTDELGAKLRERFGHHYDHDGFPQTKEYPGVLDMVRRLKGTGARVFIATNKRYAGASAMCEHFGWDKVFERLYTGDMLFERGEGAKMRKPELLAYIMREIGADASECVMIGDTNNDIEAAKKNGITSVFVGWGYGVREQDAKEADFVIDKPVLPEFPTAKVSLVAGRDASVRRRHPWIFSGAVGNQRELGDYKGIAEVVNAKGASLGWGFVNTHSQIMVRMLSFNPRVFPSEGYLRQLVSEAIESRMMDMESDSCAVRLVNAESDGLPGVVVDYYAGHAVMQITSAFGESISALIIKKLMSYASVKGVSARMDVDTRAKEGLEIGGFCHLAGEEPPETIEIEENGVRFLVDVRKGHKTGYYLDQREARRIVGEHAFGDVLNAFAYTGGFGLMAAKLSAAKVAQVTQVDVSGEALRRAAEIATLNEVPEGVIEYVEEDVFKFLRRCRDAGRTFDTIILDPPKFAETRSQVMKAARGYKDINLLAMKLLRSGGILATFSCSGAMTSDLFDKIVAEAAVDAKADMQILARTTQAEDHRVSVNFPEGLYLKGLILRKGITH